MQSFLEFVSEILGVNVEEISEDTEYQSIPQWDSLMHLRLVAEIEDKYGVEIPLDEVPDIKTLADFFSYVKGDR
jgi:acyl carrier protein